MKNNATSTNTNDQPAHQLPIETNQAEFAPDNAHQLVNRMDQPHQSPASRQQNVLAMQRTMGNTAVRSHLQRQPGRVVQRDTLTNRPQRSMSLIAIDINNQYQTLFERHMEAVTQLTGDLATPDEPSVTDQIIQMAVTAALGQAANQLGTLIGQAAGSFASDVILRRALARTDDPGVPGISQQDIALADSAAARTAATGYANTAGTWIGGKIGAVVPTAYAAVQTSLPPSRKFLEGQRQTLIDTKAQAQSQLLREMLPRMEAMPGLDGHVAAERYLAAIEQTQSQATSIQYLQSAAKWADLLRTTGPRRHWHMAADPNDFQVNWGVLHIHYEVTGGPGGAIRFTSATIGDVQQSVLDRINNTPAIRNQKLKEFPITKTLWGPAIIYIPQNFMTPGSQNDIRSGHGWLVERRNAREGRTDTTSDMSSAFGAAIGFTMELLERPISDLGTIRHP
jgi:hypothetical protein